MKLLKLTNAAKGRIGDGLILNTELISSFFEHTPEDGTKVTAAFGINNNSWEVAESLDEIIRQANA
jgi:hypothetical protein